MPPRAPNPKMNGHELKAWKELIQLGAKQLTLGGKRALDITPIRVRGKDGLQRFARALIEVVGHSGANRRHVNRTGAPVFVVTDDDPRCGSQGIDDNGHCLRCGLVVYEEDGDVECPQGFLSS